MPKIVSFEGTANGEMGGVPGEPTVDDSIYCLDFEIETPGVFIGAGGVGLLQRVYVEADTQSQALNVTVIIDGNEIAFGTISTANKAMSEKAVDLAGYIASIRLTSVGNLTKRIEVSSIDLDMFVPDHMD